jgi:hypothetical protein
MCFLLIGIIYLKTKKHCLNKQKQTQQSQRRYKRMPSAFQKTFSKKIQKNMHEMKRGQLHSGSGARVTSREQAIAISASEARKMSGGGGGGRRRSHGRNTAAPKKNVHKSRGRYAKTTAMKGRRPPR